LLVFSQQSCPGKITRLPWSFKPEEARGVYIFRTRDEDCGEVVWQIGIGHCDTKTKPKRLIMTDVDGEHLKVISTKGMAAHSKCFYFVWWFNNIYQTISATLNFSILPMPKPRLAQALSASNPCGSLCLTLIPLKNRAGQAIFMTVKSVSSALSSIRPFVSLNIIFRCWTFETQTKVSTAGSKMKQVIPVDDMPHHPLLLWSFLLLRPLQIQLIAAVGCLFLAYFHCLRLKSMFKKGSRVKRRK
jgi:hypothetical protein